MLLINTVYYCKIIADGSDEMNNNYNNKNQNIGQNNSNRRPTNNQNYNRSNIHHLNSTQRIHENTLNNQNVSPNNQPVRNHPPRNPGQTNNIGNNVNNARPPIYQNIPQNLYTNQIDDPIDIRVADRNTNYRVNAAGKPKKRLLKRFLIFILSLLIIASILISAVFIGIYSLCSKMNYVDDYNAQNENFFELLFTKEESYNILLIGIDQESGSVSRSDTMMLVTIDNKNESVKLTSFMRDLWVSIPGHGEGRLNSAYAKGGAELLIKTLKENFKVQVDNYLLINFEMFVQLIDGIGGIEVEVTKKEANFINETTRAKVDSGKTTLSGEEALIYCRIRKLDSDFMRTQRQRKVISAIFEKAKSQNIGTTIKAGVNILPLITTNISPLRITAKSISMIPVLKYEVEQLRVPVDKYYTEQRINGQQVLVPNLDKNIEGIENFITN